MPKTPPPLVLRQRFTAAVAPTVLCQEFVPDFDFLWTGPGAGLEPPLHNQLGGASGEDPFNNGGILDAEEPGASGIEPGPVAGAKIVARRKPASRVEPNLVEHPSEEDDAAYFFGITAQA